MKRAIIHSIIFTILVFCAVFFLAAAQDQQPATTPASAPLAGAKVGEWKGNVRLSLPGQPPSAPSQGEMLPPGTLLDTGGGRILLQQIDGSQILVRAHTRLMVQQPTPTERGYFQLLLGRIRAVITKRTGGAAPFELGTPSAVIAVRGTQFEVEVNKKQETKVSVSEGVVEVFGRQSGMSVMVSPGSSTRVKMNTPPQPPRPIAGMEPNSPNTARPQAAGNANRGAQSPLGAPAGPAPAGTPNGGPPANRGKP